MREVRRGGWGGGGVGPPPSRGAINVAPTSELGVLFVGATFMAPGGLGADLPAGSNSRTPPPAPPDTAPATPESPQACADPTAPARPALRGRRGPPARRARRAAPTLPPTAGWPGRRPTGPAWRGGRPGPVADPPPGQAGDGRAGRG